MMIRMRNKKTAERFLSFLEFVIASSIFLLFIGGIWGYLIYSWFSPSVIHVFNYIIMTISIVISALTMLDFYYNRTTYLLYYFLISGVAFNFAAASIINTFDRPVQPFRIDYPLNIAIIKIDGVTYVVSFYPINLTDKELRQAILECIGLGTVPSHIKYIRVVNMMTSSEATTCGHPYKLVFKRADSSLQASAIYAFSASLISLIVTALVFGHYISKEED